MGVSGTGIFSNDAACDLRDYYIEQLESGLEDTEATRKTLEQFKAYLTDSEDGPTLIIAFAVAQSKVGRLDPDICKKALKAIDSGADLAIWEADNPKLAPKRHAILMKAREQLIGKQPKRKRISPPKKRLCGLTPGDILSFALPKKLILLRVAYIKTHRLGETPILEELLFDGTEIPPASELTKLKNRRDHFNVATKIHFFSVHEGDGWEKAGFKKVHSPDPSSALLSSQPYVESGYSSWQYLVERLHQKRG